MSLAGGTQCGPTPYILHTQWFEILYPWPKGRFRIQRSLLSAPMKWFGVRLASVLVAAPEAVCTVRKHRTLGTVHSIGIPQGTRNLAAKGFACAHNPCNVPHAVFLVRVWTKCWTLPAETRAKNTVLLLCFMSKLEFRNRMNVWFHLRIKLTWMFQILYGTKSLEYALALVWDHCKYLSISHSIYTEGL